MIEERPYRREWADVGGFVKERVEPASVESEHTSVVCLYAHFRRWAHLRGEAAVSAKVFEQRFAMVTRTKPEEFRGVNLYAAWLKDLPEDKEEDVSRPPSKTVVKGMVRARSSVSFYDSTTLEAGKVVAWLEPSPYERKIIENMPERENNRPISWLIVEFEGHRRYVPATKMEKVH